MSEKIKLTNDHIKEFFPLYKEYKIKAVNHSVIKGFLELAVEMCDDFEIINHCIIDKRKITEEMQIVHKKLWSRIQDYFPEVSQGNWKIKWKEKEIVAFDESCSLEGFLDFLGRKGGEKNG